MGVLRSNGGKENFPEVDKRGGRLLKTLEYKELLPLVHLDDFLLE